MIVLPKTLQGGQPAIAQDVMDDLDAIVATINGGLGADYIANNAIETAKILDEAVTAPKLDDDVRQLLGLSGGGTTRRGKAFKTDLEGVNGAAFQWMPTPDRVTVTLATGGLIRIAYTAIVSHDGVTSNARAAIFIGANQAKIASGPGAPVVQYAELHAALADNQILHTSAAGLDLLTNGTDSLVTTGQIIGSYVDATNRGGGFATIFADAGTYDVGVKFSAPVGSIYASSRKLWVVAEDF